MNTSTVTMQPSHIYLSKYTKCHLLCLPLHGESLHHVNRLSLKSLDNYKNFVLKKITKCKLTTRNMNL